MADQQDSPRINATGLWQNKTRNGDMYLSGNMGAVRVLIFKNTRKKHDKEPDYHMVLTENRPKDKDKDKDNTSSGAAAGAPAQPARINEDNIPF